MKITNFLRTSQNDKKQTYERTTATTHKLNLEILDALVCISDIFNIIKTINNININDSNVYYYLAY